MGIRKDKGGKLSRAAHIKHNTAGSSNEISFSVLDAAKMELDDRKNEGGSGLLGGISLFTLPGRRKPKATPSKEQGVMLPSGEFVAAPPGSPDAVLPTQETKDSVVPVVGGSTKASLSSGAAQPAAKGPFGIGGDAGAAASAPSPEYEIARRKGRRKLHRVAGVAFVVVAVAAIAVAGGSYLYKEYEAHQAKVATLDTVLQQIEAADEHLVRLNDIVGNPTDAAMLAEAADLLPQLPAVRDGLMDAREIAGFIAADMGQSNDKEVAGNAASSIDSRVAMIDSGTAIIEIASAAADAAQYVSDAWGLVLEGDGLAREAASKVSNVSQETVSASRAKSAEALSCFEQADALLARAQEALPSADLTAVREYVSKRIEALRHAVASDDAYLAEDTATATAENTAYATADAEATALAAMLPADCVQIVWDAYSADVAESAEEYVAARSQAASTDAVIRNYQAKA